MGHVVDDRRSPDECLEVLTMLMLMRARSMQCVIDAWYQAPVPSFLDFL